MMYFKRTVLNVYIIHLKNDDEILKSVSICNYQLWQLNIYRTSKRIILQAKNAIVQFFAHSLQPQLPNNSTIEVLLPFSIKHSN